MSLNEVVENIKVKSVKLPDELSAINKWDILMLLVPGLTKDKATNQRKNYGRLKPDSMLFLCIDTICRLFLDMIYLDSRPEMPNDRISLRSFKHMIRMKVDELDELENELEKVKEGKGYILEEEHDKEIKTLKKEFKFQKEEYERQIRKLEDNDTFLRDRIEKSEPRIRDQVIMKLRAEGWTPPISLATD